MDQLGEMKKVVICRVLSDILIIGSGGIVLLLFRFVGSPFQRGFFCDDQSLGYPFKESTVPSSIMYALGFIIAFLLMSVVEYIRVYKLKSYDISSTDKKNALPQSQSFFRNAYLAFIPFVYGAVIEHIVTDIGKYGVGRLRPHFFDVCKVDFSTIDCTSGYIEDFNCTGSDSNRIREMRLSFPSGHSSFSSYVAMYLMIYIQQRFTFCLNSLLRPFSQSLVFCAALFICVSRISDYKHHPTDVMGGAFIGVLVAALFAFNVSDLFHTSNYENIDQRSEEKSLEETENSRASSL